MAYVEGIILIGMLWVGIGRCGLWEKDLFLAHATGISTGHVPHEGAGLPDQQGV